MSRVPSGARSRTLQQVLGNSGARVLSMVAIAVATLLVARTAGPSGVGHLAMLRVLTGLVGVLLSAGLPLAATYFLALERREDAAAPPRLAATLLALALGSGVLGLVAWVVGAPALRALFLDDLSTPVVVLAAVTVPSQLLTTVSRSCLQGRGDIAGSNGVFVLEEAAFVPPYVALVAVSGTSNDVAIVLGMLAADVVGLAYGLRRLRVRRLLAGSGAPSWSTARRVGSYGARAQLSGVLTLLNLRLDFVVLGAMAGSGVVGIYAVASKYAELLKVPSLALTYVLHPRFAVEGARGAEQAVRRWLRPVVAGGCGGGLVLAVAAPWLLTLLYGTQFRPAVGPALVLLVGLAADGVAALVTAYLYGTGRPGLTSVATAAGVLATVVLDLALIPRYGALGAAVASTVAYGVVTAVLLVMFRATTADRTVTSGRPGEVRAAPVQSA